MSVYDFLCMPFLDKVMVREEPHGLDTSILDRVVNHTTSPAPAGTAIPSKQKASIRPEISTNVTKKTRSSKKVSRAGSSGQAARDGVKQADDGTIDDGDHHDDTEFTMEDIEIPNDVSQGEHINVTPLRTFDPSIGLDAIYPLILIPDKEVKPHVKISRGIRRTTRASLYAYHAKMCLILLRRLLQLLMFSLRMLMMVGTIVMVMWIPIMRLELVILLVMCLREISFLMTLGLTTSLILIIKVLVVTLLLTPKAIGRKYMEQILVYKKKLYKDPKVCRTAIDRFLTPDKTHRLKELCSMQIIKKQNADIRQQSKYVVHANKEVSRLKAQLRVLKSKYFTPLVQRFLKSGEFNQEFTGVLNMAISVRVKRGLHMDCTDEELKELS
uniref:Uncharacterized protein n=1 Tax=Tanacetum cinerariifolium TaxID=118510 RepID=A0A699GLI6_TANCI|nr:hypothetical protein [Tanacetum cinerariifolium]